MSARDSIRAQLAALMGGMPDGSEHPKFDDDRVCKFYLCGICPHDLFSNTRVDMGECAGIHSDICKQQYEEASKEKDYGYEEALLRNLESIIADIDRKVRDKKERLEDKEDTASDELSGIAEQIGIKLAKAEELGAEGNVDESMELMKEVELLKQKRAESENKMALPGKLLMSATTQKLRVCEICSASLSIFDNDRRLADHFGGKQHTGYLKIRETVDQLREKIRAKRAERRRSPSPSRHHHRSSSSSSSSRHHTDRYSRRDDRDYDRYRRDRGYDYDYDRDRDRDRHRSRSSRDYDRDRERDRHHRSSHSSRDRERDRDERDRRERRERRSRSRSPARRDKEREKEKEKDREVKENDKKVEEKAVVNENANGNSEVENNNSEGQNGESNEDTTNAVSKDE